MVSENTADELISALSSSPARGSAFRREAMGLLSSLPGYDWCGVYRLDGDSLVLDEFVGGATEHSRIQVGVGVCGTAVAEGRNQVVEDVRELRNYLSCSAATRSEIVVLIRYAGTVLGQIDIDGHQVGAFDMSDESMLEHLAMVLAERWE